MTSPQVVSFLSSKGGSGKTVTSSALGTFLSVLGFKVMLVDADASTNGLTLLFLEQLLGASLDKERGRGMFEAEPNEHPTPILVAPNLWLVPATYRLQQTEGCPPERFEAAMRAMLDVGSGMDFILVDAQAGSDTFARIAAQFSSTHILVSEYDPVSSQGLDRLKVLFSEELQPTSTWILFNKILPEFASAIGDGLSIARYMPPLAWDVDVVRAFARRDLAINMEFPNTYTLGISQIALLISPDVAGDAIEEWRGAAISSVTDPMKSQLDSLMLARERARDAQKARQRVQNIYQMIAVTIIAFAISIAIPILVQFIGIERTPNTSRILANLVTPSIFGLALAVGGSLIGAMTLLSVNYRNKNFHNSNEMLWEYEMEIDQIRSNIEAAEALASKSDGVFSRIRRQKEQRARGKSQ